MEDKAERRKLNKKEKVLLVVVLALSALLLAAAAYLLVRLFSDGKPPEEQTPQRTDYSAAENANWSAIVLTDADGWERLTAGELNYYFWSEYFYLVNAAEQADVAYFDTDKPLSGQAYSEEQSWQQYILEQALDTAKQTAALVRAGEEAGFEMSGEYQSSFDEQVLTFKGYAETNGFLLPEGGGDLTAYLKDSYGEGANEASFTEYLRRSFYASSYSDYLYENTSVDAKAVSTYFDAYADDYEQSYGVTKENSPRLVNLRCIYLIVTDTDSEAAWQTAKEAALEVQQLWQKDPTDEAFAALAEEYTQAPGAPEGGLYEDVYPQGMETVLDDWCFATERAAGDMELLQDEHGWILAYLSSYSELSYWQYLARKDMLYESYTNSLYTLLSGYDFEVRYEAVSIAAPAGIDQKP